MIRLKPARPPAEAPAPPAPEAVIRRFFRLIRRFERRRPAIEVRAAPEIKARITCLGE